MTVKRAETCSLHTINDVFDVYCFYLLVFKRLTNRDDFNQSKKKNNPTFCPDSVCVLCGSVNQHRFDYFLIQH